MKIIDGSQLFNPTPARRANTAFHTSGAAETSRIPQADTLNISDEARRALEERAMFLQWQENAREQAQQARETAKIQAEAHNALLIAFEIAARIMRGDIVPPDDINFLGETSPGLLMMAMSSRLENETPEEHDPLAPRENHRANTQAQVAAVVSAVVTASRA
jgi:hypothetical protein